MSTIEVTLPPEHRKRFVRLLKRAGRKEIGGMLMGEQVAPDSFRIADFSVDEASGASAHFVRDPDHHRAALDSFFRRTGANYTRFNYLGEWHSHPSFPLRPSREDVRSMHGLVEGETDIAFAALMIVRLRYLFRLECEALMFMRAGPSQPIRMTL